MLHFPLAAAVAAHWWPAGGGKRALGVFAFGTTLHLPWIWNAMSLAAVLSGYLLSARQKPPEAGWPAWMVAIVVIVGSLLKIECWRKSCSRTRPASIANPSRSAVFDTGCTSSAGRMAGRGLRHRLAWPCVAVRFRLEGGCAHFSRGPRRPCGGFCRASNCMGAAVCVDEPDRQFVCGYFAGYSSQRPLPSIYWQGEKLETIWFERGASFQLVATERQLLQSGQRRRRSAPSDLAAGL